ncbi:hypothetical protein Poli38472_003126 [Pythium oligandrum]|uniref:Cyclic nucleotide-binding domain-containing protein n=1 Tax=Pythium oligandrum TaxID=41045 RepID=A0A8K1C5Z2_PYTOL|nr:hypothetical protein Poli38472_003126 [Pythium oligandrum]|eukprot:TMW57201.1 hypothetical protein Poli38472_003126 [Pythium oligandrum]
MTSESSASGAPSTQDENPSEHGEGNVQEPDPAPLSSTKTDAPRTIDRAKMNIRRGSRRLKQLLDPRPTNELELDLDTFYQARLRRRTHLEQEITGSLSRGGIVSDALSPTKGRSIMMTLSPGEEYENYQKVDAATKFQQSALIAEEPSQMDPTEAEHEIEIPGPDKEDAMSIASSVSRGVSRAKLTPLDLKAVPVAPAGLHRAPTTKQLTSQLTFSAQIALYANSAKMIRPHGHFRLGWDILSIMFIFYNAVILPFQASFNVTEVEEDSFERFIDIFFLLDIAITFNTAIELDGSIRYDRKLVAKSYVQSWFLIDLVAALPYGDIVPHSSDSETDASVRRTLKLLRLVRLLRLFRISRILRRIQSAIFIRSTLAALLRYCLIVMFISHWFSCIFHAIASNSTGLNWIVVNKLQDPYGTKWDRYVAALYFAVMTLATIGFGDICGTNADERLFTIFAMIIGGGIFAYGLTNIVELVSSLTIHETRFRQKMDEVNEYMGARDLPMKLRIEIREFYHNTRLSRESRLNSEQSILAELSSKLRSKIALSINDQFLRKFPFFTGSDPNFLLELALNMRMIHFAPLEDVIIEGEVGHEMFFVFRGAVEVLRDGQQIGILGENQYFGEMAILSPDNRRRATVRTLCFCELRMLSRNRFLEALALFPQMQSKMAQVARSRMPQKPGAPPSPSSRPFIKKKGSPNRSDLNTPQLPPPQLVVNQPSSSRLSLGNATTSASVRLLQASQRTAGEFVPLRSTTSARLNSAARRQSSVAGGPGVSAGMLHSLTETSSRLEEVSRRQETLIARVIKLQMDLAKIRSVATR